MTVASVPDATKKKFNQRQITNIFIPFQSQISDKMSSTVETVIN